jgi:ATP-dependent protease ClpP protease subunit
MKSIILMFVAVVATTVAQAGTVNFQGMISKCSMHRLVSEVQNLASQGDPNITILIGDSNGGDLYAAIDANEKLRQYNVNTYLHGDCASSCTALYAVGRTRSAKDGSFMFHATKVKSQLISVASANAIAEDPCQPSAVNVTYEGRLTEAQQRAILNKFAGDWLNEIRKASPSLADDLHLNKTLTEGDEERWISIEEARKYGFVNSK